VEIYNLHRGSQTTPGHITLVQELISAPIQTGTARGDQAGTNTTAAGATAEEGRGRPSSLISGVLGQLFSAEAHPISEQSAS